MTLFRTVEPAAEPVTLAEVKAHLRIAHASEDALLEGLVRAAREDLERATGIALIDQNWRLALDHWPSQGCALLTVHPVREILSVTAYRHRGRGVADRSRRLTSSTCCRGRRGCISRRGPSRCASSTASRSIFRAGYGEAGTDVPDLLKRAILLLVGHWYEFRAHFGRLTSRFLSGRL